MYIHTFMCIYTYRRCVKWPPLLLRTVKRNPSPSLWNKPRLLNLSRPAYIEVRG